MAGDVSLIEGVYRHRLVEAATPLVDDEHQGALARSVIDTCRQIEEELTAEVARLRPVLDAAGVAVDDVESLTDRQNHTITFLVADAATGEAGVEAIRPLGYVRWEQWSGGALESFRRSADQVTAGRTDGWTTVVRFRWRRRRHRSRLDRALTPTAGDWHLVQLPAWAWWAYPLVRIGRLAAERAGLRPRHRASLGPFLSTPDALLTPLLEQVGVSVDDVVVDIGAGDGRIAVAAAEQFGCRAIGVEQDAGLVEAAGRRIAEAGLGDLVSVERTDGRTFDLSGATVVVLFLPIDVVADLFDELADRLATGTRVLVHEQSRLPAVLRPDSSAVIVGRNAVTVAHVWTIA